MTDARAAGTALVTGASSGIGQATARLLAASGYRVFGTSRHDRPNRYGVEMLRLDVGSSASVAACVDQVHAAAGHLDVLVNNAGVLQEGFVEETALEDAARVFDTNLFGVARVTSAVLPEMRARRAGRIVNVGSLAAWVGEPGAAYYAASKAALTRYSEALRHEVWHLGIGVSVVEPGTFATNVLGGSVTATARHIPDYDGPRENARAALHDRVGRADDPREVAALILRVLRDPAPKLRYGAGRDGRWVPRLRTVLPQRTFDRLLRRGIRLPDPGDHARDR